MQISALRLAEERRLQLANARVDLTDGHVFIMGFSSTQGT